MPMALQAPSSSAAAADRITVESHYVNVPYTGVRALHSRERVEILCHNESVRESAKDVLDAHGVAAGGYQLHIVPNDRVWLRDSAPTFVWSDDGTVQLTNWRFNGWAKYENHTLDERVGEAIEAITGLPRLIPRRHSAHKKCPASKAVRSWAEAPSSGRGPPSARLGLIVCVT